jgi:hypothetical protein
MLKQKERVMDAEKMLSVVRAYRSLLSFIPPLSGPFDKPPTPRKALAHTAGMLDKIEAFVKEGTPEAWDKANRWLGFLQGVFWVQGIYTLDQMRDHNRDGIKSGRPAAPIAEPPELAERLFP